MGQAFPGTISRTAAVVAPGLMVMAIILFMGKVSGAHLNPAVSLAFSLRGDFPWRRVPGYIVVQLAGAALAAWFLQSVIHVSASFGSNYPASGFSSFDAFLMEAVLTARVGERHPGHRVRRAEPRGHRRDRRRRLHRARRIVGQPDLRGVHEPGSYVRPRRGRRCDFTHYWVYVAGPLAGAVGRGRRRVRPPRLWRWPRRVGGGTGRPGYGRRGPGQGVRTPSAGEGPIEVDRRREG